MNVNGLEMFSQQHPSAGGSVVLHDSVSVYVVSLQSAGTQGGFLGPTEGL